MLKEVFKTALLLLNLYVPIDDQLSANAEIVPVLQVSNLRLAYFIIYDVVVRFDNLGLELIVSDFITIVLNNLTVGLVRVFGIHHYFEYVHSAKINIRRTLSFTIRC